MLENNWSSHLLGASMTWLNVMRRVVYIFLMEVNLEVDKLTASKISWKVPVVNS